MHPSNAACAPGRKKRERPTRFLLKMSIPVVIGRWHPKHGQTSGG